MVHGEIATHSENQLGPKQKSQPANNTNETDGEFDCNVLILGEGKDELGKRYFKFAVRGSANDLPVIPVDKIIDKSFFSDLAHAGGNIFTTSAKNELAGRLQNWQSSRPLFIVATKMGSASDAFVLPNRFYGKPRVKIERYFRDLDPAMVGKYRTKGDLQQWRKRIAKLCAGNTRLMFAVSLALTGPILRFVPGSKAGGFQICGPAESGKTTAAKVAGSVWGCHRSEGRRDKGFIESWNSTKNKIEVTALAHNETLLILDETKTAGSQGKELAKTVLEVVFRLSEQTERDRLTNSAPARGWRCYFLSTSNLSLAKIARDGHMSIDESYIGRLTDVPLPTNADGLFEDLHGYDTGDAFSNVLQSRSLKLFGSAGPEFVRLLEKERHNEGANTVKKFLRRRRKAYLKTLKRRAAAEGLKPLRRISDKFATTYAAGGLAIKYGILPWNRKQLLRAILSCQFDQLKCVDVAPGAVGSVDELRSQLVQYLNKNHKKFRYLKKGKFLKYGRDKVHDYLGFRETKGEERYYYLTPQQLSTAIGDDFSSVLKLKHLLADEGLLLKDGSGHFVVQRRIYQGGKGNENFVRVHAFKAEFVTRALDESGTNKGQTRGKGG